ncbi:MAG: hypothetical protein WD988_01215 [Candidatus Curtissbacteria bacterium]
MIQNSLIRKIYLYSFAFLGLVLVVFGLVRILDLGLKVYVFKQADQFAHAPYPAEKLTSESREPTQEEKDNLKREQEATEAKNRQAQRQSTASNSLAMIIVGLPLFLYHWKRINTSDK